MTREETKRLVMVIVNQYPIPRVDDPTMLIDAWHLEMQDYSFQEAYAALRAYNSTSTSGYRPSIGQIITGINKLKMPQAELNEGEAWDVVYKAICNSSYHAREEFEALPPILQKVVGSPQILRMWGQTEIGDAMQVVQSNFERSYRKIAQREFERACYPEQIKELLPEAQANKKQIADKEGKKCILTSLKKQG